MFLQPVYSNMITSPFVFINNPEPQGPTCGSWKSMIGKRKRARCLCATVCVCSVIKKPQQFS